MKVKVSLLLIVFFFSLSAIGQTVSDKILHTVEPGQTLYFISKKYNLSIDEIRKSNPLVLDDLIIKPSQVLNIPVKNVPTKIDDSNYKIHVVKTKETLFSISQIYGTKVTDLISLNNLENANIDIGQDLKVKKINVNDEALFSISAAEEESLLLKEKKKIITPKVTEVAMAEDVLLYKQLFDSYGSGENQLNKDKGIGNYLDGNSSGAYLAMVNNVPAEQIVKVRNLMNNKVIYLKVVGPVSAKDAEKNIAIKISKSAANDLNIIEDRFLAEWTWYSLATDKEKPTNTPSSTFDDF
ncbi:MAG: LysM repeat protein [Chitinophagales bacterium]|jgi:LysM repeat protein